MPNLKVFSFNQLISNNNNKYTVLIISTAPELMKLIFAVLCVVNDFIKRKFF